MHPEAMLYRRFKSKYARCVFLVVAILTLLSTLRTSTASTYYNLIMQSQTTISPPEVILEEGTVGTSTIYANSTSAKVSVTPPIYDFVDINTGDVDSIPDKGTHSNFLAQQAGPDSIYDTLTEENMGVVGEIAKVGTDTSGTGNSLTLSFSHTLVSGTARIVIVSIGVENGDTIDVSTVTYGGVTMTLAVEGITGTSGFRYLGEIWYILENDLPSDGSQTVEINCSGTPYELEVNGFCSEYTGVTQGAPEATADHNQTTGATITNDISPSDNAWVISVVGSGNAGSFTHDQGQVEVLDFQDFSSTFAVAELRGASGETSLSSTYSGTVNRLERVAASWTGAIEDDNYELDLEVQWTNADYDETNEELATYVDKTNTYSLDATGGYMIVGDGTPDWGSTTGTISFWIKMDTSVQGRFWGQDGNMETRWSGTNLVLDWGGTGSMISYYSFSADIWYFVAIVWDENNNNLFLYVGDENNPPILDANSLSGTWTSTTPAPTENRFLNGLGGAEPVDGHGDDLRYWNIARSLAEIQSDYNTELTGSETNLRSYFKLNNSFDDIGPDNNDGSGSGSYSFSTDVPFPEDIRVDVWNGISWQNLFTDLTNGWNNVSVSSYLNSSTFTIRFKGGSETGDTSQDSWNIDTTLLHVWTNDGSYDYVLKVNDTVTDSWQIRLKKYDDSNIDRLQNCTIYFHDSTDGNSIQIEIQNGFYINQTGPWYDLGGSETIYIALTVQAKSKGTSHIYTYLEVRKPGTTIYAQYVITFEIT